MKSEKVDLTINMRGRLPDSLTVFSKEIIEVGRYYRTIRLNKDVSLIEAKDDCNFFISNGVGVKKRWIKKEKTNEHERINLKLYVRDVLRENVLIKNFTQDGLMISVKVLNPIDPAVRKVYTSCDYHTIVLLKNGFLKLTYLDDHKRILQFCRMYGKFIRPDRDWIFPPQIEKKLNKVISEHINTLKKEKSIRGKMERETPRLNKQRNVLKEI
jgi:hypothetical protein